MSRKSYYRLHKWIAICAGVFLLSWIVSGIVMILPNVASGRRPAAPLDYREAVISPAQAAAALDQPAVAMTLERMGDLIVYRIQARRGFHLVDARSGRRIVITPKMAETLVRSEYPVSAREMAVERLDRRRGGYGGTLPAYRLTDATSASQYFVAIQDGSVHKVTRPSRARSAIASLHTFSFFNWFEENPKVRRIALFGAALGALAAALTGYFLALPKRLQPSGTDPK